MTLKAGIAETDELRREIVGWVRTRIGPIATPDFVQWASALPKNRAGKILRRILTKVAADDFDNFGDTSTLADPAVVADIVNTRKAALKSTPKSPKS